MGEKCTSIDPQHFLMYKHTNERLKEEEGWILPESESDSEDFKDVKEKAVEAPTPILKPSDEKGKEKVDAKPKDKTTKKEKGMKIGFGSLTKKRKKKEEKPTAASVLVLDQKVQQEKAPTPENLPPQKEEPEKDQEKEVQKEQEEKAKAEDAEIASLLAPQLAAQANKFNVRIARDRRVTSPPLPLGSRPAVIRPPSVFVPADGSAPLPDTADQLITQSLNDIPTKPSSPTQQRSATPSATASLSSLPRPTSPPATPPSTPPATPPASPSGKVKPSPRIKRAATVELKGRGGQGAPASPNGPSATTNHASPSSSRVAPGVIGGRNALASNQQRSIVQARASWKEGDQII